ncbi:uncharacterized protein LOC121837684, partial [Ixodes scapularis]|uniref:uncharacterized protein LOC121837684 n=1 Tax=Ixodes scapularis TaxID=6945 RepID=UPI001C38EAEB
MNKRARDATEFLWQRIRPQLPKKTDLMTPSTRGYTTLGEAEIPPEIGKPLELGPMFCFEPVLSPPELVTLAKNVAEKATEGDRPRCIHECVEVLQSPRRRGQVCPITTLVDFMVDSDLRVMLSDKEGQFVVLPKGMFNEKANAAIEKNFRPVNVDLKKLRDRAKGLCDRLALTQLAVRVGKAENVHLQAFFSAKTHKEGCPFRAIVTENGSWQRQVASYLQKQLSSLNIKDPFRVFNSLELVEYLEAEGPEMRHACSIDVEDLFYSLPHDRLLEAVKGCIEANGELAFRSSSGVSLETFLELLLFYLQSMVVGWQEGCYRQKSGVCIGSCVAPVLRDIYLGEVDCGIERELGGTSIIKIIRYVDDFLVFFRRSGTLEALVDTVVAVFEKCGGGLRFTFEVPKEGVLQYLDLSLRIGDSRVCWTYRPRSKKGILDWRSAHSKVVKRGIVTSCLSSALKKSCLHTLGESFRIQTERLRKAGYPTTLLSDVASKLLKKVKGSQSTQRDVERKRPVVIPNLHRISHNLKNVGKRHGIPVVFSAPEKMSQICPRVHAKAEGIARNKCSKKHARPFVPCATGVVYSIPLSCGSTYVGQTGRCLNERLREHRYSLGATVGGHLSVHCKECLCEPSFSATTILGRHRDKVAREVLEAFHIQRRGKKCISAASVALSGKELEFLKLTM